MAQQTDVLGSEIDARHDQRELPGAGVGALARTQLRSTPGFYRRAWRRFRQNKVSLVSLFVCIVIVAFSLSADLISTYVTGYTYTQGNLRNQLQPPFSEGHILGTDANGRDVLTRLAYGGRVSLMVAALAGVSALAIGGTIGSMAGYFGGFIDTVAMRAVDVLLSIPSLALLILVAVLYRPGPVGLAFVIAALSWTGISRLIRGETLSLKGRDYIEAARVVGASNARIILKHIMPNVFPIMVVWISLAIPALILTEATLSFLGLGVRIPNPSWGNMLQGARDFYTRSWTNVFIPGFMIYITVLAINLVGNGLRDALDPRLND